MIVTSEITPLMVVITPVTNARQFIVVLTLFTVYLVGTHLVPGLVFLKSDKSELGWLSQESGVTREWSNYWSKKLTLLWSKRLCISGPIKKDYTLRNLNYIFCKREKLTSNQLQLGDTSFVSPHARILCFRQGLAMEVAKVTSCDQLYKNQSLMYNNILHKYLNV